MKALWSKGKAWKDMNERRCRDLTKGETTGRIDCELTAVYCFAGFSLNTSGPPVPFHHFLRHTHTESFLLSPVEQLWTASKQLPLPEVKAANIR